MGVRHMGHLASVSAPENIAGEDEGGRMVIWEVMDTSAQCAIHVAQSV